MLVRDPYSGYLHEVPTYGYSGYGYAEPPFEEAPDLSEYEMGEVVYDGLGNPVGLLPALLPMIASALPAIASALPQVTKVVSSLLPSGGGMPVPAPIVPSPIGPVPVPIPMPAAPYAPPGYGPGPASPIIVGPNQVRVVRRPRRRRFHVG
jgi:hypothetical protein